MQRLTKRNAKGEVVLVDGGLPCFANFRETAAVFGRLAAYEDAEEQGLLIKLPVPIGTTVFIVDEYEKADGARVKDIWEPRLTGYINEGGGEFYTVYDGTCGGDVKAGEFFTTREAAEAAAGRTMNV